MVCAIAYSPDIVLAVFIKDKAVAEAYRIRRTRVICLGRAAECPKEQPPAPASFDLLVSFQDNSDKLTQPAKDNLRQFAKALMDPRLKGEKFEIDGHTSAVDGEKYNLHLSERRANSVVSYLASQGVTRLGACGGKRLGARIRAGETEDLMARADELLNDGGADKACGAGDEYAHDDISLTTFRRPLSQPRD